MEDQFSIELLGGKKQLSPFAGGNVVYVANVLSLFFGNAPETHLLEKEILGVHWYGGRLVTIPPLVYGGDAHLLVLERAPEPALIEYFDRELPFALPEFSILPAPIFPDGLLFENHTANAIRRQITRWPAEHVDGFVTDLTLVDIAQRCGKKTVTSSRSSYFANHKSLLQHFLEREGLPIFDTLFVHEEAQIVEGLAALRQKGYSKAVLKAPIGASGIGIEVLETRREEVAVSEFYFQQGECLLQGWIDSSLPEVEMLGSPSVEFWIDADKLVLFDFTDQILDAQSIHQGNCSPMEAPPEGLQEEMQRQSEVVGRWLHQQGYHGLGSIDFLVYWRGGALEVVISEVNARVTGGSYPSLLARALVPGSTWLQKNFVLPESIAGSDFLQMLDRERLLWKKDREEGVLPLNFVCDRDSHVIKGQLVYLAPDFQRAVTQNRAVETLLNAKATP